jgi:hypothetical protein
VGYFELGVLPSKKRVPRLRFLALVAPEMLARNDKLETTCKVTHCWRSARPHVRHTLF